MKLRKIHIQNFRGIKNLELDAWRETRPPRV